MALPLIACGRMEFATIADARGDAAAPQPLARWRLDEAGGATTVDTIGGANGVLEAGLSAPPAWIAGTRAGALSFAGDGDRVMIGNPAALGNLSALTVSAWVRPDTLAPGANHCVLDKANATNGWVFRVNRSAPGDVSFTMFYADNNVLDRASNGGQLAVGRWAHVAATWDGSPTRAGVHIYIDGVEASYSTFGTDASGTRMPDAITNLGINCLYFPGPDTGVRAAIDDLQLFDRALTAAELAAL
jgi:hypothetical protein